MISVIRANPQGTKTQKAFEQVGHTVVGTIRSKSRENCTFVVAIRTSDTTVRPTDIVHPDYRNASREIPKPGESAAVVRIETAPRGTLRYQGPQLSYLGHKEKQGKAFAKIKCGPRGMFDGDSSEAALSCLGFGLGNRLLAEGGRNATS